MGVWTRHCSIFPLYGQEHKQHLISSTQDWELSASTPRGCSLPCDFPQCRTLCCLFPRLCRLDGTQVLGKEELVHGGYYVAVGAEEYKKLPYFELLVPQDSTHRTPWYVGCG